MSRFRGNPDVAIPVEQGACGWKRIIDSLKGLVKGACDCGVELPFLEKQGRRSYAQDVEAKEEKRADGPGQPMPFPFRSGVNPFLFVRVVFENFSVHAMEQGYRRNQVLAMERGFVPATGGTI